MLCSAGSGDGCRRCEYLIRREAVKLSCNSSSYNHLLLTARNAPRSIHPRAKAGLYCAGVYQIFVRAGFDGLTLWFEEQIRKICERLLQGSVGMAFEEVAWSHPPFSAHSSSSPLGRAPGKQARACFATTSVHLQCRKPCTKRSQSILTLRRLSFVLHVHPQIRPFQRFP